MAPLRYSTFLRQTTLSKARLTQLETQVNALQVVGPDQLTNVQIEKVKAIKATAFRKNNEFESMVTRLFTADPIPEEIDDDEVIKRQDEINDLFLKINSVCNVLSPVTESKLDQSQTSSTGTSSHEISGVRLPRLVLGTFSGQPEKWVAFSNLFENSVHKNSCITDVEKFTYLLSCLSGEPLNLIKNLPVTTANYHIAWQQLVERYNNSRLLITIHVNNILDLPSMHGCSVKQLRTFVSNFKENETALRALKHDISAESLFLTAHILRKFDNDFRKKFENKRDDPKKVPSIEELLEFIENECTQLEAANLTQTSNKSFGGYTKSNFKQRQFPNTQSPLAQTKTVLFSANSDSQTCAHCRKSGHTIYKCFEFANLTPDKRLTITKTNALCNNCLSSDHNVRNCSSSSSCRICRRRHHSLLHLGSASKTNNYSSNNTKFSPDSGDKQTSRFRTNNSSLQINEHSVPQKPSVENSENHSTALVGLSHANDKVVLLGTALVQLNANGKTTVVRAVLDSAAQQTFITVNCAKTLGLTCKPTGNLNIIGISSTVVSSKGIGHVNIGSVSGQSLAKHHTVIILEEITSNLPRCYISNDVKELMHNLTLADPNFDIPAPVDMLLGADLFAYTLCGKPKHLGRDMPTALCTVFGYVLIGHAPVHSNSVSTRPSSNTTVNLFTVSDFDLHTAVQNFWTAEVVPEATKLSQADRKCNEHFIETHTRLPDGKYQVRLPLKQNRSVLGDSEKSAYSIFRSLEQRLARNSELKKHYIDFMQDYESSGHMFPCPFLPSETVHCFLPHHEVFKDGKIRVVFNASSVTSSGTSLNSILQAGPKLHNDIPSIILGFRRHRIVFTCDIRQMFRNIWLHPEDRNLQLIYWRNDPCKPLQIFKLCTVTYGMASSPFLANRVIQQLISDERENHPLAAAALKDQIYVDDALLGSDTVEEGLRLQQDVTQLMEKGGFSLRKWSSNNSHILDAIPPEHRGTPIQFCAQDQPLCNVLGLKWLPDIDVFAYVVSTPTTPFTKRSVLSTIARLYDPLGWLTPVILWAKAFMQLLWTKGTQWDDPLPPELESRWSQFTQELALVDQIQIPRYMNTTSCSQLQLHGFCDASETGFCATVYLRVTNSSNSTSIHLLMAKSRVAPLKRVVLPRLELCGAHMLSKLLDFACSQLLKHFKIKQVFAWCDATIVLSWIKTPPYRLKTYVGNRVAQIQEAATPIIWSHIASPQNPADCGSRGILASQLLNHHLWWTGPSWLSTPQPQWPQLPFSVLPADSLPELKPVSIDTLVTTNPPTCEILTRYSSWIKLVHVVALIFRFYNHCKTRASSEKEYRHQPKSVSLPSISVSPSIKELDEAKTRIILLAQQESFSSDIVSLQNEKTLSHHLQKLSPFLDSARLIRLRGRLKNADISYNAKHPILLPKNHFVTRILIDHYHISFLHCGAQQLQSLISQKYWILSARSVIKSRIFRCIQCYRTKPKLTAPIMGDLPGSRVSPTRPFSTSAVDYAGPINIKLHHLRKLQTLKVYICLFICMSTKAIHIEVVTDLTSDAFIAALKRFISRRGFVSHLYSDNGKNFVGASRKLIENFQQLTLRDSTQRFLTDHHIDFHFIPPRAPHFGGIWERAIQNMKNHLRRVIGDSLLSYEEFTTLLCQVEAILNSRPLTPLSSEPGDFEALTPGHFIVGGPLVCLPEPDITEVPTNRLKRWQQVKAFIQRIWKRWHKEYLYTLQQRSKWTKPQKNLEENDLVVVHEDNLSPLQWKLGRIIKVFPGKDNVVRVAEIITRSGRLTRPVTKLSPLPLN